MKYYFLLGIIILFFLYGCTDSNETNSGQLLRDVSVEQYSRIKGIPEDDEGRKTAAYQLYVDRSNLTGYLLANELDDDKTLKVKMMETKNTIVLQHYFDQYLKNAISQKKVEDYYREHLDDYTIRNYELAHILLHIDTASSKVDEVLQKARSIYRAAKAGEKFEKLVSQYSEDFASKKTAGVIGKFDSRTGDKRIVQALTGLSKGDISQPVLTPRGVHLFKVLSLKTQPVPREKVSGQIEYRLKLELKRQEYQRLLQLARKR